MIFNEGSKIYASTQVNVRNTPGFSNKPEGDVFTILSPNDLVIVNAESEVVDALTWRKVTLENSICGWVAETDQTGESLFTEEKTGISLHYPCDKNFPITQYYGENPQVYARFGFQGHNGVDWGLPVGNNIYAMDAGTVDSVKFDAEGFGHYVKLIHPWGQSLYAHLVQPMANPGQHIVKGQVIGLSGNSGFSTGPHVHVQVRVNPFNTADGMNGCFNFIDLLEN